MIKHANVNYPIHEIIAKRWSPYRFADRALSKEDLLSLFEAARWAPSSYNEQPWRYIIALKEQHDEFQKLLSCLVPANQEWAQYASVLALGISHLVFDRNGKENKASIHDLGAAAAHICFEATVRGIYAHQMIGIEPDKARKMFKIPDDYEVLTGIAIGYLDESKHDSSVFSERDQTPRTRKNISEFVYSKSWKSSYL